MAFQAEQKIKIQILSSLGTDQVFRLLSDHEVGVVMKTLGLLRNLLSTKPHIDLIMAQHGRQIMQAVILILEGEHSPDVKEQALCILANIADGETAKEFIMSNEDVLRKLTNYMVCSIQSFLQKQFSFIYLFIFQHKFLPLVNWLNQFSRIRTSNCRRQPRFVLVIWHGMKTVAAWNVKLVLENLVSIEFCSNYSAPMTPRCLKSIITQD